MTDLALFDLEPEPVLERTDGTRPGYQWRVFTIPEWQARDSGADRPWWWARHAWRGMPGVYGDSGAGEHVASTFTADLRCIDWDHRHGGCHCVGDLLHRIVCSCGWNSTDRTDDNGCAEEWCDHAWPGWRDLPVVPEVVRPDVEATKAQRARFDRWLEEHHPPAFRQPGAPIRSERRTPGTRHVPGGSPYGGYDLSGRVLDPIPPARQSHHGGRTWHPLDQRCEECP